MRRAIWMIALSGVLSTAAMAGEGGGRITFSGEVITPTCDVAAPLSAEEVAWVNATPRAKVHACTVRRHGKATPIASYRVTVSTLRGSPMRGRALLRHFVNRLPASHRADARVVTRTYR